MFNKNYEYGELINHKEKGFIFITEDDEKQIDEDLLIKAMNRLGEEGWELVISDEKVGFIFKK